MARAPGAGTDLDSKNNPPIDPYHDSSFPDWSANTGTTTGDKYEPDTFGNGTDKTTRTSVADTDTDATTGDKYDLPCNAFLNDKVVLTESQVDKQLSREETSEEKKSTGVNRPMNEDAKNDKRRNYRLQGGVGQNKNQNTVNFPGGHNKANENRVAPTAAANPLSKDAKSENQQKQTQGKKKQVDKSVFVEKETKDYFFFWRQGSVFSQWHPAEFTVDGQRFNCAEQYMMYHKAKFAKCEPSMIAILAEPDPDAQKSYGRNIQELDYDGWSRMSPEIVKQGNRAKFLQNEALLEKLLSTYPKKLVEASPHDQVWGIGLSANDPRATNEAKWQGANLLGRILTELRDELLLETGFLKPEDMHTH